MKIPVHIYVYINGHIRMDKESITKGLPVSFPYMILSLHLCIQPTKHELRTFQMGLKF